MAKAPNAVGQEIGRKISAKDMGFDKERLQEMVIADKANEHFLYRIVGVGTALKPYKGKTANSDGETQDGFGILGQFEATSVDGEVKTGSVCYLPGYVQDMVIAALSMPDAVSVRFAFDIYAVYDKVAATSYVFKARDLLNESTQGTDEVKEAIKSLAMPSAKLALPSA